MSEREKKDTLSEAITLMNQLRQQIESRASEPGGGTQLPMPEMIAVINAHAQIAIAERLDLLLEAQPPAVAEVSTDVAYRDKRAELLTELEDQIRQRNDEGGGPAYLSLKEWAERLDQSEADVLRLLSFLIDDGELVAGAVEVYGK